MPSLPHHTSDPLPQAAVRLADGAVTVEAAHRETGHASASAFARAFRERFHATPRAFAALRHTGRLRIHYDGPFDTATVLTYLGRDPHNAAERVAGRRYTRHLPVGASQLLVHIELGETACTVALPDAPDGETALAVHGAVTRLLGLAQPLKDFHAHAGDHPVMGALLRRWPGLRVPQTPTPWEALCWAVLGQQINLAFAYRLRNRLVRLANGVAPDVPQDGTPLPFPSPEQVLAVPDEALTAQQFSRGKVRYLKAAAAALTDGELGRLLRDGASPDEVMPALRRVTGIGPWTGNYVLMRGLGHADALPVGDAGLRNAMRLCFGLDALPNVAQQEALMAPFHPYRSLACYYLWKALGAERAA